MLSDKSVIALLALAEMVPISAGAFDLSIGWGIGLYHILTVGLIDGGIPWPLVVVIVLGCGLLVGTVIGLLVTRASIDPFIASLGVGTFLFGVSLWYAPQQIVTAIPPELRSLVTTFDIGVARIPIPFVYVVVVAIILWTMFERLPLGRYLYMLGANQRAAELIGISPKRYVTFAFQCLGRHHGVRRRGPGRPARGGSDGHRTGLSAACVRGRVPRFDHHQARSSQRASARSSRSSSSPSSRPAWRSWARSSSSIPMFNGIMLVASVGLAAYAARRRMRIRAAADAAALQ